MSDEATPKRRPVHRRILKRKKLSTKRPERLSEAHRRLVDEYFGNGCVSYRRAAEKAGYAPGSAGSIFRHPDVVAEIERRQAKLSAKTEVTEARIIEELAKIAFSNLGDLLEVNEDGTAFLDLTKMTEGHKAAMSEFQVETYEEREGDSHIPVKKSRVKWASKQAALEALARINGMFKDKVEVSGAMNLVERIQQARQMNARAKADRV